MMSIEEFDWEFEIEGITDENIFDKEVVEEGSISIENLLLFM